MVGFNMWPGNTKSQRRCMTCMLGAATVRTAGPTLSPFRSEVQMGAYNPADCIQELKCIQGTETIR